MTPTNPFLEGTFWDKFWRPIRSRALLFTPESQDSPEAARNGPERDRNGLETDLKRTEMDRIGHFQALWGGPRGRWGGFGLL